MPVQGTLDNSGNLYPYMYSSFPELENHLEEHMEIPLVYLPAPFHCIQISDMPADHFVLKPIAILHPADIDENYSFLHQ